MNPHQRAARFVMKARRNSRLTVLERLYSEHREVLDAFIHQRAARVGVEAEDVTQELFVRLANNGALLEKMQRGEVSARPYLVSMANNLLVDMARSKGRRDRYEDDLRHEVADNPPSTTGSPEATAIAQRELGILKQVIMELKPSWRQAFVLNRFGNLTYREIALHMGVSDKQVENFMARALVRIRKAQEALDR